MNTKCNACGKEIEMRVKECDESGLTWHASCFCCCVCGALLNEKSVNIRGDDNKLYCGSHVIYEEGTQVRGKMKRSEGGADGFSGPPMGDRPVWDAHSPDHECECPGPPPRFHIPPPPRPRSVADCPEDAAPEADTCEAVPVIDAEYRYSPAIPSFAIILTVAAAVVAFLLIGTFLVLLKRRKMQNLFPRKSPSQNRCDTASANGAIYEDLTNVRPRTLSPHCPPGQTTLPSIEMIDAAPYLDRTGFGPVLMRSASPPPDAYDPRELFNPVYEELSNGSAEGGETDSEGMPPGAVSEDEFAEDELSLGGDAEVRGRGSGDAGEGFHRGFIGSDACRDLDSSDADDKSRFLENPGRNGTLSWEHLEKGRRTCRGPHPRGGGRRARSWDRRRGWRQKAPPAAGGAPVGCGDFHDGFLLKRILQIYPDVTGVGLQYSRGLPGGRGAEEGQVAGGRYESLRRHRPEVFSTFGPGPPSGKNQSQDSSLGSDSGYSNNTSGGKSSARTRKDFGIGNHGDSVLS